MNIACMYMVFGVILVDVVMSCVVRVFGMFFWW